VFLLCLVAAASDPLLRQWEAAHDLAVSLAEVVQGGQRNVIEPPDDAALDEPGQAVLNAGPRLPSADNLAAAEALPTPALPVPVAHRTDPRRLAEQVPRPPAGSPDRHPLLQRFLF
jgi:hypothetical protein